MPDQPRQFIDQALFRIRCSDFNSFFRALTDKLGGGRWPVISGRAAYKQQRFFLKFFLWKLIQKVEQTFVKSENVSCLVLKEASLNQSSHTVSFQIFHSSFEHLCWLWDQYECHKKKKKIVLFASFFSWAFNRISWSSTICPVVTTMVQISSRLYKHT